jgi:hypothetical protein
MPGSDGHETAGQHVFPIGADHRQLGLCRLHRDLRALRIDEIVDCVEQVLAAATRGLAKARSISAGAHVQRPGRDAECLRFGGQQVDLRRVLGVGAVDEHRHLVEAGNDALQGAQPIGDQLRRIHEGCQAPGAHLAETAAAGGLRAPCLVGRSLLA